MSEPPPSNSLWIDPPPGDGRVITHSFPCINCNYDLQGLDDRGVCPECGMHIDYTDRLPPGVQEILRDANVIRNAISQMQAGFVLVALMVLPAFWWLAFEWFGCVLWPLSFLGIIISTAGSIQMATSRACTPRLRFTLVVSGSVMLAMIFFAVLNVFASLHIPVEGAAVMVAVFLVAGAVQASALAFATDRVLRASELRPPGAGFGAFAAFTVFVQGIVFLPLVALVWLRAFGDPSRAGHVAYVVALLALQGGWAFVALLVTSTASWRLKRRAAYGSPRNVI